MSIVAATADPADQVGASSLAQASPPRRHDNPRPLSRLTASATISDMDRAVLASIR